EAKFLYPINGNYYLGHACPLWPLDYEHMVYGTLSGGYVTNIYMTPQLNSSKAITWNAMAPAPPVAMLNHKAPSKLWHFAEGASGNAGAIWGVTHPSHYANGLAGMDRWPIFRHTNNSMPISFGDGHAGLFLASEIVKSPNPDIINY
ncbi:MAG: hypothetical protein ACYTGH_19070, partial [Planctomycetota bacterium]